MDSVQIGKYHANKVSESDFDSASETESLPLMTHTHTR